jgi:hypothetical protein
VEALPDEVPEHRTALYVDFDNIYLGLRTLDPAAAEAFASRPAQWIEWLESGGGGQAGAPHRRFLVRNVYLNPVAFGSFRAVFTRSGFRAVDCPPLTGQGKNSADIYMVLDIMDALGNATRYDEFVILSADADFTPVLHRLRSQDRRTTIVTAGLTAAAYRATCDTFVTAEQLVAAALGDASESDDSSLAYAPAIAIAPSSQARETAAERAHEQQGSAVEAVTEAVRAAVRAAERPLTSAAAAQAALGVDPAIKESDWYGAGSFRAFLALYLDDLSYEAAPPGYVFDPARHSTADIPRVDRVDLGPFLQQVCTVTGAPALSAEAYRTLFRTLAEDLAAHPFHLTLTSKRVRDRTDLLGEPVPRNAIAFVIKGLIYVGQGMTAAASARSLAEAWARNVCSLCATAQMPLTEEDEQAIHAWIVDDIGAA